MRYKITKEEYEATMAAMRKNKHKKVDKRLQIIVLRYKGLTNNAIGERLGYNAKYISNCVAEFKRVGLEKYSQIKYGGNHRSLSVDEENEILEKFKEKAENGQIIEVKEIKKAFDERIGKDTGTGYIYIVLARHNWRKVMPRAKHPKKANEEAVNASKKLNQKQGNEFTI